MSKSAIRKRSTPTTSPTPQQAGQLVARQSISYTGPLPPAAEFDRYESTLPGAAHRILAMAESQSSHRWQIERQQADTTREIQLRLVDVWSRNTKWGMICGTFISTVAIAGGIALAWSGKSAAGLGTIITALVGLVGSFVYGMHKQSKVSE